MPSSDAQQPLGRGSPSAAIPSVRSFLSVVQADLAYTPPEYRQKVVSSIRQDGYTVDDNSL